MPSSPRHKTFVILSAANNPPFVLCCLFFCRATEEKEYGPHTQPGRGFAKQAEPVADNPYPIKRIKGAAENIDHPALEFCSPGGSYGYYPDADGSSRRSIAIARNDG
jgi:hypothetical protein